MGVKIVCDEEMSRKMLMSLVPAAIELLQRRELEKQIKLNQNNKDIKLQK
ncbi:MAG: hypothetical protein K0S34_79 [Bacillales bacterium]|jgi:hypothetical protein|nr:hypothetical protein [Bacillales bacterium]